MEIDTLLSAGLNKLALHVLKHGDKMTVDHMAKLFQLWEPSAPSWWNSNIAPARTEMLSDDTTVRIQRSLQ